MSVTTWNPVGIADYRTRQRGGRLARLHARIVGAQQARADRLVRNQFARLDDAELADLGYAPGEISRIRTGRPLADPNPA